MAGKQTISFWRRLRGVRAPPSAPPAPERAAAPEAAAPEAAAPEAIAPDAATPDSFHPDHAAPNLAPPDFAPPDLAPPTPTPPQPDGPQGRVEAFEPPFLLRGWAMLPGSGLRLELVAQRGGLQLGQTLADLPHPDLPIPGDDRAGFRLRLAEPLERWELDGVELILRVQGRLLGRLPIPAEVKAPRDEPNARLQGEADQFHPASAAGPCRISGWAALLGVAERVQVVALRDGAEIGRDTALSYRRDLLQRGQGDGFEGFRIDCATPLTQADLAEIRLQALVDGVEVGTLPIAAGLLPTTPGPGTMA